MSSRIEPGVSTLNFLDLNPTVHLGIADCLIKENKDTHKSVVALSGVNKELYNFFSNEEYFKDAFFSKYHLLKKYNVSFPFLCYNYPNNYWKLLSCCLHPHWGSGDFAHAVLKNTPTAPCLCRPFLSMENRSYNDINCNCQDTVKSEQYYFGKIAGLVEDIRYRTTHLSYFSSCVDLIDKILESESQPSLKSCNQILTNIYSWRSVRLGTKVRAHMILQLHRVYGEVLSMEQCEKMSNKQFTEWFREHFPQCLKALRSILSSFPDDVFPLLWSQMNEKAREEAYNNVRLYLGLQ
jgi:hypothetical protein